MKNAIIITQAKDLSVCPSGEMVVYFCTNESSYRVCLEKGLECELLDEQSISSEYIAINDWAYQSTMALLDRFKDRPDKHSRLDAAFIDVKAVFVETLKISKILNSLKKRHACNKLYIPASNRDTFFGTAMQILFGNNQEAQILFFYGSEKENYCGPPNFKQSARSILLALLKKRAVRKLIRCEREERKFVFASGSLKHLEHVITQLRQDGCQVMYCESEFNLEKLIFCLKKGVLFYPISKGDPKNSPFTEKDILFDEKDLVYDNKDYSQIFQNIFLAVLRVGLLRNPYDGISVDRNFSSPALQCVLLDEDFSCRRLFYVHARKLKKPCFVISHGVPALFLGNKSAIKGQYTSSVTFVQSDFEKSAYESIYLNPSRILVTGLPRYDRLVNQPKKKASGNPAKKTILYCGSIFYEYDFRSFFTVLGCKEFLGDFTKRYLFDLLDFCAKRPEVILDIKPHYNEEGEWMRVIQAYGSSAKWRLRSHRDDIISLANGSDVLVTPESSVISEAIMLGKPVVVLNYGTQNLSTPCFERDGVIWHARNKEDLHQGLIKSLEDGGYLAEMERNRKDTFSFYAGAFDGLNRYRVTEAIHGGA